jgi:putative nucleotidyltransferase with HDIG domain
MRSQRVNPRSARVAESQQLGDFVEGFAGRIVEGGPDIAITEAPTLPLGQIKMGVATRNHQRQGTRTALVERLLLRQQNGVNMPLKMIHCNQGLIQREGQGLGVSHAYQQCACQAWPLGDGNGIQAGKADTGLRQRGAHYGNNIAQVFAGSQLRNHPAIGRMNRDLGGHHARQDAPSTLHHSRGSLVTGAFDGQNQAASLGMRAFGARERLAGLTHVSIVVDMATSAAGGAQEAAAKIVARLRAEGYEAYFVGGCVRDLLLGRPPADFDVATSAPPDQVLTLFERTFSVGAHFGVVLVVSQSPEGQEILTEVATFRSDGAYSDGRRPDAVRFSTSPHEDVKRRDFTINGMMLDPVNHELLDLVGGRRDLDAGLIRAIGAPGERFSEDKLRMLRAVRFAARFGFEVEPETWRAIQQLAPAIGQVSRERVREELTRMLTEGRARRAFELLDSSGLLLQVLPKVAAMKGVAQPPQYHPEGDVWVHTLLLLDGLAAGCPPALAWGALLHDVGKPPTFRIAPDRIRFDGHVDVGVRIAEEICRRLRFANQETEQILLLIANHMRFADVRKMKQSTLKRFFRLQHFDQHLALHRLDCLASYGSLELYDFARRNFEALPQEQVQPPLLLSGKDLIEAGYRPGPHFKEMLALAEDAQLEGVVETREQALALIQQRWPQGLGEPTSQPER